MTPEILDILGRLPDATLPVAEMIAAAGPWTQAQHFDAFMKGLHGQA